MEGIDLSKYLKNIPEYIHGTKQVQSGRHAENGAVRLADNGYCSLRKLEDNCRVNMRYMYLMNWKTPSYRTFGYFINEVLAESIEAIFQDINLAIFAQEKVDLSHLYIDGTKLEANANRYSWVWKKATEKSRYRLFAKITALLDEINEELSWSGLRMETNEEYVPEHLAEMLAAYAKLYQLDEADFVHGKGRRKTIRQRHYERLQAYMRKLEEYRKKLTICGDERNSYARTDHSATFMRLNCMGNDQLLPACNIQIGVADRVYRRGGRQPLPLRYGLLRAADGEVPRYTRLLSGVSRSGRRLRLVQQLPVLRSAWHEEVYEVHHVRQGKQRQEIPGESVSVRELPN